MAGLRANFRENFPAPGTFFAWRDGGGHSAPVITERDTGDDQHLRPKVWRQPHLGDNIRAQRHGGLQRGPDLAVAAHLFQR